MDRDQAMTRKVELWAPLEIIHEVELSLRAQPPEQVVITDADSERGNSVACDPPAAPVPNSPALLSPQPITLPPTNRAKEKTPPTAKSKQLLCR
jgi:hypothetical protein